MSIKCRCPKHGANNYLKFGQPPHTANNHRLWTVVKLTAIVFAILLFMTAGTYAPIDCEDGTVEIVEEKQLEIPKFTDDFGGDITDMNVINNHKTLYEEEQEKKKQIEATKKQQSTKKVNKVKTVVSESKDTNNIENNNSLDITKDVGKNEYPIATKIWNYLKNLGYTDAQAAGVLGNMMVEAGGGTLNINPSAHNSAHWGICQWSKKYCPQVWGSGLDYQLNFYKSYVKTSPPNGSVSDVAYWFWKEYERSSHYSQKRTDCAWKAYNYFVK